MKRPIILSLMAVAIGCGDSTESTGGGSNLEIPEDYAFTSRFDPNESSVAYGGQVSRQVFVAGIVDALEALTSAIDSGDRVPVAGEVEAELAFYFDFDDQLGGSVAIPMSTDPELLQSTFSDLGTGRDLAGKIAGNDPVGQHEDWSTALMGAGDHTPESRVRSWFGEVDALAVSRANGSPVLTPSGEPVASTYVTEDGRDLRQLIEKFLRGAIAYSQGTDDYLDDDTEGKGLLSTNTRDGDAPYTALEHQWDEGFGYFGAARDYASYSDDEIAGSGGRPGWSSGYHDSNGDGAIDLQSEFNFGHAVNAAKRDRGAVVPTDMTARAIDGFLRGRAIIAGAEGELDPEQLEALQEARDQAVLAWEEAIAATAIHYVNDVLQDMGTFGTDGYSFEDHAKHWSELKGFALSLQFNPRSQIDDATLATVLNEIGDAPVLPTADEGAIEAYRGALRNARALLGEAYGFAADNLGDDAGLGGW